MVEWKSEGNAEIFAGIGAGAGVGIGCGLGTGSGFGGLGTDNCSHPLHHLK
jgi:hypothetical protein